MISQILGFLFPPTLTGAVRDWEKRVDPDLIDESSAGPVRTRKYRDGIDRHFAEQRARRAFPELLFSPEYAAQTRGVQEAIRCSELQLSRLGYVNTIHDCWERVDD